jgi:glycine betaine/proline transport system ATP-binding protein
LQAVLRKTIVFITHDFEEAIRLADRVAIMRDGAVVQVGSPEELVLHPATDYVREFTRNVPRSKVLSVKALMQPASTGTTPTIRVRETDRIETIAPEIVDGDCDAAVVDSSGVLVGVLARRAVLNALTNRA